MKFYKIIKLACLYLVICLIIFQLSLLDLFTLYEWSSIINDLLQLLEVDHLISFSIGFKCYAARKSSISKPTLETKDESKPNFYSRIKNSGIAIKGKILAHRTSLKGIARSYSNIKYYINNLMWNFAMLLGLDKILSPVIIKLFYFFKVTFSYLLKVFTIVNIIIAIWIFYFNTPVITGKLLLGIIGDFFRVAWNTYTDNICKFFDYINKGFENGFKSLPKHAVKPVEYPNNGFIKEYRELFRKLRELVPSSEISKPRWYDSLRDLYKEPIKPYPVNPYPINPNNTTNIHGYFDMFSNIYSFMKDYWYIGAIVGGVVITGGTLLYFWDPISNGALYLGNSIKTTFTDVIHYLSSKGPDSGNGDSGGSDSSSIIITDLTQENPNWDELISRFPNVPNTPINWNSGASTPSNGGDITPIASDLTARVNTPIISPELTPTMTTIDLSSQVNITEVPTRFSAPKLTLSISDGTSHWDVPSRLNRSVADSPVLSNIPNLGSDLFTSGNASVSNSPVLSSVPNNIFTSGSIHIPSDSDTTQAINSLTQNASGPDIFPQDFDSSI